MELTLRGLSVGYESGHPLVRDVDLDLAQGQVLCLLGRNGVGKTTLFRSVLGLLEPLGGRVLVDGRELHALPRREQARRVAHVPQSAGDSFGYTVREVVLMGRSPWLDWYAAPGAEDHRVVDEALERLGIAGLAGQDFTRLSGGQRQMVLIARALAQQTGLVMMDEPMSSLDLGNEARVLEVIDALAASGITIVFTSHRPDHAFTVADQALLLQPDGAPQVGPVDEVLTEDSLRQAFGVDLALLHRTGPDGRTVTSCVGVPPSRRR